MPRQPWWPKNFYDPNATFMPSSSIVVSDSHMVFEEACEAMDAAWRKKIEAVYEGPIPASEHQDDPVGLLDWFVVQLLKEQNDD